MKKKIRKWGILLLIGLIIGVLILNKDVLFKNKTKEIKKENKIIIKDKTITDGIFKDYYKKAEKVVSNMSINEKVGQLFLVRYEKNDTTYLNNFYPGGYILFAKDFNNHTKESMKEELDNLQEISKYPLIIGVDEEGGYVTRVSR